MSTRLTIDLPKQTKDRLARLALRYGFSLSELSRRVFEELSSEIPEESFNDYKDAARLRASLRRAVRDWRAGRVRRRV
ncbi:MAG: hypothetical protein G01um101438_154 [Parcubacteria group bacterium Gr01-1014_38]|nr:MAG: hypothetical protein G01um101438_154 [Parcubacteria group bacterium Gr01-1014_38]